MLCQTITKIWVKGVLEAVLMQAFPFDLFLAMQDNGLAEKRSVFLEVLYKFNSILLRV